VSAPEFLKEINKTNGTQPEGMIIYRTLAPLFKLNRSIQLVAYYLTALNERMGAAILPGDLDFLVRNNFKVIKETIYARSPK
jgi:hypothetical protein